MDTMWICRFYINGRKTWSTGISNTEQPWYQPILDWTDWPVLGSFKNWNIIKFTNKDTSGKYFDEIHTIFLAGISVNMVDLF